MSIEFLKDLEDKVVSLLETVDNLKSENDDLKKRLQESELSFENFKNKCENLEGQLADVNIQLQASRDVTGELNEERDTFKKELEESKAEAAAHREKMEAVEGRVKGLLARIDSAR